MVDILTALQMPSTQQKVFATDSEYFRVIKLACGEVCYSPAGWYCVPCWYQHSTSKPETVLSHMLHTPVFFPKMFDAVERDLKKEILKFNTQFAKWYSENMWKARAQLLDLVMEKHDS